MEKSARDYHQRKAKSNEFVSSEMRKQILRLQDKLRECESGISRHSNEIEEIQDALAIAQECVGTLVLSRAWRGIQVGGSPEPEGPILSSSRER